jgi:hypothetical protein
MDEVNEGFVCRGLGEPLVSIITSVLRPADFFVREDGKPFSAKLAALGIIFAKCERDERERECLGTEW